MGDVSILLEPLLSAVLFLSRESVRIAIMRSIEEDTPKTRTSPRKKDPKQQRQRTIAKLVNFSYVAIVVGGVMALAIAAYYMKYAETALMRRAMNIYMFCAWVELLSEPFYTMNVFELDYAVRAKIEAVVRTIQCVSLAGGVLWVDTVDVMVFAYSQLLTSLLIFVIFAVYYGLKDGWMTFVPQRIVEESKGCL